MNKWRYGRLRYRYSLPGARHLLNACIVQHMGQGANSAILDAAALGTLFHDLPDGSPETVSDRLRLFDEIRVPHNSAVQLWSEIPMFEQPTKKNADVKAFLPDLRLPGESARGGALRWASGLLLGKFTNFKKTPLKSL